MVLSTHDLQRVVFEHDVLCNRTIFEINACELLRLCFTGREEFIEASERCSDRRRVATCVYGCVAFMHSLATMVQSVQTSGRSYATVGAFVDAFGGGGGWAFATVFMYLLALPEMNQIVRVNQIVCAM